MRSLVLLSFLLVACGGKVAEALSATDDASTDAARTDSSSFDTGRPDTRPTPVDVGPPPPPPGCAVPLSPAFTCVAPTPVKGQTVCTDDAIKAIVNGCFTGSGSGCDAARKKYPACDNCMLRDWLDGGSLNVGACVLAISPGNPCGKTVKCGFDCLAEVCADCDPSPGTSPSGGSEMDDCYTNESDVGGKCYAIAMKDYPECAGDPKLSVCFPMDVDAVIPFYRGACRDGGDWTKAFTP